MAITVDQTLSSAERWNPTLWEVPVMEDVHTEPWAGVPGRFWNEPCDRAIVDVARTNQLPAINIPMTASAGNVPHQGSSYGQPYQLVSVGNRTYPIWDQSRPAGRIRFSWGRGFWREADPIERWPLPSVVRRSGDPLGAFDKHCVLFDPDAQVLYEAIQLVDSPVNRLRTFNVTSWCAGYDGGGRGTNTWDCTRPWDAPGQPGGMVAINVPKFPMIVRWDQIVAAIERNDDKGVGHAMFLVLPNYSREFTYPARGSDGNLDDFPLRGGEHVRLRPEIIDEYPPGSPARVIAATLFHHGAYVGDRNTYGEFADGSGRMALSQDRRWRTGEPALGIASMPRFETQLNNFEVVVSA